jgi:hypothetical protein
LKFPIEKDFDGSVRGLAVLHDTYDFNVTATLAGKLEFKTVVGQMVTFETRETLATEDLFKISKQVHCMVV